MPPKKPTLRTKKLVSSAKRKTVQPKLRPVEVTIGRDGEKGTEISGPQVKEGMEIILGQQPATPKPPAAGTRGLE